MFAWRTTVRHGGQLFAWRTVVRRELCSRGEQLSAANCIYAANNRPPRATVRRELCHVANLSQFLRPIIFCVRTHAAATRQSVQQGNTLRVAGSQRGAMAMENWWSIIVKFILNIGYRSLHIVNAWPLHGEAPGTCAGISGTGRHLYCILVVVVRSIYGHNVKQVNAA